MRVLNQIKKVVKAETLTKSQSAMLVAHSKFKSEDNNMTFGECLKWSWSWVRKDFDMIKRQIMCGAATVITVREFEESTFNKDIGCFTERAIACHFEQLLNRGYIEEGSYELNEATYNHLRRLSTHGIINNDEGLRHVHGSYY